MTTLEEKAREDAIAAGNKIVAQVGQLVESRKLPPAIEMSRAALANGIAHPLLLQMRAYWHEQDGRFREAIADLKRAIELSPAPEAALHNALGVCYGKAGRWTDAVVELETAVAINPRFVGAQYNLATARESTGDLTGSESAFRRVLELAPGDVHSLSNLANLAARRADWDEARKLAEQALAADPKQYLAMTTLADVAVGLGDLDNADALIASTLTDPEFPPVERTMMLTLKGDVLHERGQYNDAFRAYSEANAQRRQLFAGLYAAQGRETAGSFLNWLVEYFDRAPREAWSAKGRPAPAEGPKVTSHVFLIGFARSGTTLLENILSAHPDIVALEEKEVLADSVREFFSDDKGADRLAAADEATLARFREAYWQRVAQHCPGRLDGKVFVDKRPLGAMKLPLIAKLFPTAKILFALRDPRDVVLSCYRRYFQLNPSMYEMLDLRGGAKLYASTMTLSAVCRGKFDLAWQETRHETLIDDFDGETKRIFDFVGVDWSDEVRDFAEKAKSRSIATPSATQVIKGLNRDGVGQWRHYRAALAPVQATLRPWVEKYGYTSA